MKYLKVASIICIIILYSSTVYWKISWNIADYSIPKSAASILWHLNHTQLSKSRVNKLYQNNQPYLTKAANSLFDHNSTLPSKNATTKVYQRNSTKTELSKNLTKFYRNASSQVYQRNTTKTKLSKNLTIFYRNASSPKTKLSLNTLHFSPSKINIPRNANISSSGMKFSKNLSRPASQPKLSKNLSISLIDKRLPKNPIFSGDYILNNVSICPEMTRIMVVILVHTSPDHFIRRQNIRSSFGSRKLYLPVKVRVVFLLGRVKQQETQNLILKEHRTYGDTVQGAFMDDYKNLTYKGVMGLHWVSNFCRNVKYVIKMDDDVAFDMWRFLGHFSSRDLTRTLYCGGGVKGHVRRTGKWSVPEYKFRGYKRYPFRYCYGFVVIISSDMISKLYQASFTVPFFWIDDVYLYGMLPLEVGNVNIIRASGHLNLLPRMDGLQCLQDKGAECPLLAVTVSETTFNITWNLIQQRNSQLHSTVGKNKAK
ncbi:uncharacterized protein LOC126809715 [Patella vulgata]|uniref:uncharacterized protein LOC126809715 n=1 Tax=Patella vulgata TaxID=6465 RepID=UPI0024A92CCC|nr:uncharacterized protein LOC126809715 [Patella vulgata]